MWLPDGFQYHRDSNAQLDGARGCDPMLSNDFSQTFSVASEVTKNVKAPPGLELADVAWPLVSAYTAEVDLGLRDAISKSVIDENERQAVLNRLVHNLYVVVFGATSRVMVVEMAAAESTSLVPGETPEERYSFFANMLQDPLFCLQILDQYPVLKEQLVFICRNWRDSSLELVTRLVMDWELIHETFFRAAPVGKIANLEISAGDAHKLGRSTCIVQFVGGSRLVYKPRSLAVDMHYQAFADWINRKLGKQQILVPETVDRGEYGWSAFIAHDSMQDEEELARYYERLGAVLALAYLTGLSDLHAENVIAHRSWPVLVDLETLFRPVVKDDPTEGAAHESNRILDQSVLATQLLAARSSNDEEERIVDMGGIVDLDGQKTLFKVPVWKDLGRIDARLDFDHQPFGAAKNIPVLNGIQMPADFGREEIISGFVEVYRLLHASKTELRQEESPLEAFREDHTRVVLRPTTNYARLVSASFHPNYLQDARRKNEFFNSYLTDVELNGSDQQDLVAAEIDDLWQCDIPYFKTRAGSQELISSHGRKLKMRLVTSGLELAYRRLDGLGEADLAKQCWLVRLLLARGDNQAKPEALPLVNLHQEIDLQQETAKGIVHTAVETICSNAIFDADRQRATWHTVGEAGGVATVTDAALDLYSGLPGIALFLCQAGRLLDKPGCIDLARCALNEILARIDIPDSLPLEVGGFVGSGGLAYALQQMADDFPDLDLSKRASVILLTADHEAADEIDVAYGLAGALISCLTVYRDTCTKSGGDRQMAGQLLDRASMIGSLIVNRIAQDGSSSELANGFAHGRAGIAVALVRLFVETGDQQIEALARKLLNETAGIVESGKTDASWCRGQAGLVLALAEGIDLLPDRQALASALEQLCKQSTLRDHSLCHGAMGIVTSLHKATSVLTSSSTSELSRQARTRHLREIYETGILCGTINSVVSPGLMDGIAGIGLGAICTIKPNAVPLVLSLNSILSR